MHVGIICMNRPDVHPTVNIKIFTDAIKYKTASKRHQRAAIHKTLRRFQGIRRRLHVVYTKNPAEVEAFLKLKRSLRVKIREYLKEV